MPRRKSAPEPVSVGCGDGLWGGSATFSARRQPGYRSTPCGYRRGPAVLDACAAGAGGSASGRVRTGRARSDAGACAGHGTEVGLCGTDAPPSLSLAVTSASQANQTMGALGNSRRAAGPAPRTVQPIHSPPPTSTRSRLPSRQPHVRIPDRQQRLPAERLGTTRDDYATRRRAPCMKVLHGPRFSRAECFGVASAFGTPRTLPGPRMQSYCLARRHHRRPANPPRRRSQVRPAPPPTAGQHLPR